MILGLFKYGRLFLEIIFLVALIVLIFLWNPFGIFGGRLKLQHTANLVMEIREMGELITAEYYGEVIASMDETRLNFLEEDQVFGQASYAYHEIVHSLEFLRNHQNLPLQVREAEIRDASLRTREKRIFLEEVKRNNLRDKLHFHGLWEDLNVLPFFDEVVTYLYGKKNNSTLRTSLNNPQREDLLFYLYQNTNSKLWEESGFMEFYYQTKINLTTKREAKKKLALIGRGWVKAGFDFGNLDQNKFYLNEEAEELHFFGVYPQILNADINPWFIPEKGIPGFEILDYNGRVDFRDTKKVKEYAIEKLIANAHSAAILNNAEIYGAETLKRLFTLITGKEIKRVYFHHDRIIQFAQDIIEDEFISYPESLLFHDMIQEEKNQIDSLMVTPMNRYKNRQLAQQKLFTLKQTINNLKNFPFEDLPGNFNYFSTSIFEIATDSLLDSQEKNFLSDQRNHITGTFASDSALHLWADDSLQLHSEFSQGIGFLLDKGIVEGNVEDSLIYKENFNQSFLENNWIKDVVYLQDTVQVSIIKTQDPPQGFLLDQLFPFMYDKVFWGNYTHKKDLHLASISVEDLRSFDSGDSSMWVYDGSLEKPLIQLNLPFEAFISPHLIKQAKESQRVWVKDRELCFFRNPSDFNQEPNEADEDLLTLQQKEELKDFYCLFSKTHKSEINKDPISRANDWFKSKWEKKSSIQKKSSLLKEKF